MIEALLAIIDRLITLVQGRIAGRKELFDRILEPTFNDLLLIHGDYVKMFEHTLLLLDDDGDVKPRDQARPLRLDDDGDDDLSERNQARYRTGLNAAKNDIREKRLQFEPVRLKVRAIAQKLEQQKFPDEERAFMRAVLAELPTGEPYEPPSSAARTVVEYLEKVSDADQIDMLLRRTMHQQRESWSRVCEAFAALKIKLAQLR